MQSSETLKPGLFNLGVFANFAVNSLPYFDTTGGGRTKLDDTLLASDVNLGVGVLKDLDVGISLPAILSQSVQAQDTVHGEFSNTGGTEVRVNSKYRLMGDDDHGVAVIGSVNFNRVVNDPYAGTSRRPTYNLELAADTMINKFSLGANIGHRWRQPGDPVAGSPIQPLHNQWIASVAASYLLEQIDTKVIGEIFGGISSQSSSGVADRGLTSLELLIGAKHDVLPQLAIHAGAGTGLIRGVSSPDWRVYAGLNYVFGPVWHKQEARVESLPMPAQEPPRFTVGNILFEFNSAILAPNHAEVLADLVDYLKKHEFKKLRVEGHTDSFGRAAYNKALSQRRAQAVVDYLAGSAGIPRAKLEAEGFGSERPIADNGNYQGREKNRRVEFQIIK